MCDPGTYALGTQIDCTYCDPGYHCPSIYSGPVRCPSGYYSGINAVNCTQCEAGYQCSDQTGKKGVESRRGGGREGKEERGRERMKLKEEETRKRREKHRRI